MKKIEIKKYTTKFGRNEDAKTDSEFEKSEPLSSDSEEFPK